MLTFEEPRLGVILEERVVESSVPDLKGLVRFECVSWDGPLKTSLVTMWELMKPSWCPHPISGLIWDVTADVVLNLVDDGILNDLAVLYHLLTLMLIKQDERSRTESSGGNSTRG